MRTLTLRDVMRNARLFGSEFASADWFCWRAFATALSGLAPNEPGMDALIRECTGRDVLPSIPAREAWCIVGRRGGKSRIAALVAVYRACLCTYKLAKGERGVVMVIAADRRQARVVFRYVLGLLNAVPMLAALVVRQTKDAIDLSNGISIEVKTASYKTVRGFTVVACICDELAFWSNEDAADPDAEVLNALRPAMATVPGALLMVISSPYARRGELWRAYQQHFGKDGDVLVWVAPTWRMNPAVPRESGIIAQAYADDDAVASAEYGAEFRRDVESFLSREVIDAATIRGRHELPPLPDISYQAFVDPSGGASDSFTLAIAHGDNGRAVLDVVRETKPPFSPESVITDYAALLKLYRINVVTGDRYAGEFPREQLRKHGVDYEPSAKAKSDIYRDLLPLLNSGRVDLLDVTRLLSQLANLERRTARGGRDSIDHGPKAHDDVANAAAGALLLATQEREPLMFW